MKPSQTQDLYARLEIDCKASPEEIKKSYRKATLLWHPDRNKSPDARDQFEAVKDAYDTLSDPKRRIEYDKIHWIFKQENPQKSVKDTERQPNLEELIGEIDEALGSYNKKGGIREYYQKGKIFDSYL